MTDSSLSPVEANKLSRSYDRGKSANMYLSLLKSAITASLYPESAWKLVGDDRRNGLSGFVKTLCVRTLSRWNFAIVKQKRFDMAHRSIGEDWPMFGFSMIGHRRLDNVELCLRSVVNERIDGDFVECGVWRGGASIFAKGVLNILGDDKRAVWLADSFEGMPEQKDSDKIDLDLAGVSYLAVSQEEVAENFKRFDLLDGRVKFLKGWFSDTLARSDIERIAVLRLDGDLYSSTMDAISALYDKVSYGGYIIVDDYGNWQSCKKAIHDFLDSRHLAPTLTKIDNCGVFWRK